MFKSVTCLKSAATAVALLSALAQPAFANGVSLVLSVSNVTRQICTGLNQPTCTSASATGFSEMLRIDEPALSTFDTSTAGFPATSAIFGFPYASTGNPYTGSLQSILTMPPTLTTAFSQFDNNFDTGGGAGLATALIFADQTYDDGNGLTGEFLQTYSLQSLLSSLAAYDDLTTTSLFDFLSPLVNQLTGSYFSSGAASALSAASGSFTSYAYTSYSGDVTLSGIAFVPEPATLALVAAALAAASRVRRAARRQA